MSVKELSTAEIRKLIRMHNKLTDIKIPKGSKRDDILALLDKNGYKVDHEKKAIVPKVQMQRKKTIKLKDSEKVLGKPKTKEEKEKAKKEREKKKKEKEGELIKKGATIGRLVAKKQMAKKGKAVATQTSPAKPKEPPKPKEPQKPKSMSDVRKQMKEILKNVPAQVKAYKSEGAKLKTLKELLKLKTKYRKPFTQEFGKILDMIEEEDWFDDEKFENIDSEFDKALDKDFEKALEELRKGLKEVVLTDRATKRLVRFYSVDDVKKYFKDFKNKYINQSSNDAVSGSLLEKYNEWIKENESKTLKEMETALKSK